MLGRCTLIGLAPSGTEHLAFSQDPIFTFCSLFAILGSFSPRKSRFSAPNMQDEIVARVLRRTQICFTDFYDEFLMKKNRFSKTISKTCQLSLSFSAINFKMTFTGGNPWPFYVPTKPFGPFAAFLGSWGFWFKSIFTYKNVKNFSNFFSSSSGTKKLRIMDTTTLASEWLWKAPFMVGKDAP